MIKTLNQISWHCFTAFFFLCSCHHSQQNAPFFYNFFLIICLIIRITFLNSNAFYHIFHNYVLNRVKKFISIIIQSLRQFWNNYNNLKRPVNFNHKAFVFGNIYLNFIHLLWDRFSINHGKFKIFQSSNSIHTLFISIVIWSLRACMETLQRNVSGTLLYRFCS